MSSVQSKIAQPKTRKFVVTQDDNNGEAGARMFSQTDINNWLAGDASYLTQVGSVITVTGDFVNILNNLGYSNSFNQRKTLTDMGATVYIGNSAQSELLVLRLVQVYAPAADGNSVIDSFYTGYVVVENNVEDGGLASKFRCAVARI